MHKGDSVSPKHIIFQIRINARKGNLKINVVQINGKSVFLSHLEKLKYPGEKPSGGRLSRSVKQVTT